MAKSLSLAWPTVWAYLNPPTPSKVSWGKLSLTSPLFLRKERGGGDGFLITPEETGSLRKVFSGMPVWCSGGLRGKGSGRPWQVNHHVLPTRSCFSMHWLHSHRNGISSITLSHMEKVPRGPLNYNSVIDPRFREGRLFSGSGSWARLAIEKQELKPRQGLQCGKSRLVVYFLCTLQFHCLTFVCFLCSKHLFTLQLLSDVLYT